MSVTRKPYQYVVLRCVPRPDREEFLNVGVVLYCQAHDYLAMRSAVTPDRVRALDPSLDVRRILDALAFTDRVCGGSDDPGEAAGQPIGTRFGFVKAPRSTVLQPGPVHGGLTADPERELERLFETYVG